MKKSKQPRHFIVYVIELDDSIREKSRFRERNPKGTRACLYVGSTGKTAQERFRDHAEGLPSGSSFIRGHVKCLRPELAPSSKLLSRANAETKEQKHAESLRRRGYQVWQC